jgi:hypothetical protein
MASMENRTGHPAVVQSPVMGDSEPRKTRLRVILMVALAAATAGTCNQYPAPSTPEAVSSMTDSKDDCERLMTALLPFAEQMLAEYGEFFPFGGTMSVSGDISQSMGWTGEEQPSSQELIDMLKSGFRAAAESGEIRATVIIYDTLVVPPGKNSKQDAISVALDHRNNYSVIVAFPYSRTSNGQVQLDEPFASPGPGDMFAR